MVSRETLKWFPSPAPQNLQFSYEFAQFRTSFSLHSIPTISQSGHYGASAFADGAAEKQPPRGYSGRSWREKADEGGLDCAPNQGGNGSRQQSAAYSQHRPKHAVNPCVNGNRQSVNPLICTVNPLIRILNPLIRILNPLICILNPLIRFGLSVHHRGEQSRFHFRHVRYPAVGIGLSVHNHSE